MYERIPGKSWRRRLKTRGRFFTNKEPGRTYAFGSSGYKFKEYPFELVYAPPVIDKKQEEVIGADRAAYLKKIEKPIKTVRMLIMPANREPEKRRRTPYAKPMRL